MKKHTKGADGKYHINGKKYDMLVGSRAQVWHGTAYKTSYDRPKPKGDALTKSNLKMNKHGRIVSLAKSKKGPQMLKRLHAKGYFTRKGKFGFVKKSVKGKTAKKGRKKRGKSVKRVTIKERRSTKTGRFVKGGRRKTMRRRK